MQVLLPSFKKLFIFELEKTLASFMYTPRPFHHNIHEAEFIITGGLKVQRLSYLSIDVISRVGCWLFYFDACPIYNTQTLREAMCSIEVFH